MIEYPRSSTDKQITEGEALVHALIAEREREVHVRIDQIFCYLLPLEWAFAVFCSVAFWPMADGPASLISSLHFQAAIILGAIITIFPILIARFRPGTSLARQCIAIAQISMSGLLIHLTGGRIETHFHIFGSLAFLTFYRDWRVIITASVVTAIDHLLRGVYFPLSIYGILDPNPLRWLEHAGWVAFEDIFLIYACFISRAELRSICKRQSELIQINATIESKIQSRTIELAETHKALDEERSKSLESSRLASLGEMAGGIAHEINNPLAVIVARSLQLHKGLDSDPIPVAKCKEYVSIIERTSNRIANIVSSLKNLSRSGNNDPMEEFPLKSILDDTITLCSERFRNHGIEMKIDPFDQDMRIACRPVQISQVILNLLNNAFDAVSELQEKWVRVEIKTGEDDTVSISITDSGRGIPEGIRKRIMEPFFTTKEIGRGTGLGLSISKNIIKQHGGTFKLDTSKLNTCFVATLPMHQNISPSQQNL